MGWGGVGRAGGQPERGQLRCTWVLHRDGPAREAVHRRDSVGSRAEAAARGGEPSMCPCAQTELRAWGERSGNT